MVIFELEELSRKSCISTSDFSNVVGETLLKLLSVADVFLAILQEFRKNYFKEYLETLPQQPSVRKESKRSPF